MAKDLSLKLNIEAALSKSALDAVAKRLKEISDVGKVEFVDKDSQKNVANLHSEVKQTAQQSEKLASGMQNTYQSAKQAASQGALFTKAFNFNQIFQSITAVTQAFDQFIGPYKEFDKQLKNIGTLGVKNFEEFRNEAIDLAASVPDTVAGVTQGIYNAISAGAIEVVDGQADIAQGMKFVEQASKLAVAGLTDTNAAIKGLSAVTNAYGPAILSPEKAADTLFATVKNGVTTVEELNSSMANVVPIAAAAGINFEQVGAAFATMTKQGTPTAEASTKIRAAISELLKPGAELKKVMEEAGVSMATLKQDGLQTTMSKLGEAMDRMGTNSANTFSSIEAIQFSLATTGDNAQKAASDLEAIKDGAGSVEQAFNIANEGIGVKIQGILNQVEAFAFKVFGTLGDGVTVMMGAANSLAPMITAFAGLQTIIPAGSLDALKKYSSLLTGQVVPGLITYDATTKKAAFNTNALTLSNLKNNIATKASAVGLGIQTAATKSAALAQKGLNLAFISSPIGWIVAGLGAVVGAMILLYKNVEPVRKVMDDLWGAITAGGEAAWNGIKVVFAGIVGYFKAYMATVSNLASAVMNVLKGDFSSAVDDFKSIGADAGKAFSGEMEEQLNNIQSEKIKDNLQESLSEGIKLNLQIDEAETYNNFIGSYEKVMNEINTLKSKKTVSGLTDSEIAELKALEKEAGNLKIKLAEINPEIKKNVEFSVNAQGDLVESFDVNIERAKQLNEATKSALDITDSKNKFSDNMIAAFDMLDTERDKLKEIEQSIKISDSDKDRKALVNDYKEQLDLIQANKQALLEQFNEGAKAGLITESALKKVSQELGITTEQAKEMLLAKALKEASTESELTKKGITKIAEQYGFSYEKAKQMLDMQKEQTKEAGNTADAIKNIAAGFDKEMQELNAEYDKALKTAAALRLEQEKGSLSPEKQKALQDALQTLQTNSVLLKKSDSVMKSLQNQYSKTAQTSKSSSASMKQDAESMYDAYKKTFEQMKDDSDAKLKQIEISTELAALEKGRYLTDNEQLTLKLNLLSTENQQLNEQKKQLEELRTLAAQTTDPKQRAKDLAEVNKMIADNNQDIQENKKNRLTLEVDAKINENEILENVEQLQQALERNKLELQIELGVENESELVKFDIGQVSNDIAALQEQIDNPDLYGLSDAQIVEILQKIEKLEFDKFALSQKYNDKISRENINAITDEAQREAALRKYEADMQFKADMARVEKGNFSKEQAYQTYAQKILAINADMNTELERQSLNAVQSISAVITDSISQFSFIGPDNRQAQEDIEEQRKVLKEQYKAGEIDKKEYYTNLEELDAEYKQLNEEFNKELAQSISDLFAQMTQNIQTQLSETINSYKNSQQQIITLRQQTAELESQIADAQADKDYEREKLLQEKKKALKEEEVKATEDAQSKMTDMYIQTGAVIGTTFASVVASGESATKALVVASLRGLQALIPVIIAKIYGKELASLSWAGLASASGLTAVLSGLLAVAEAKVRTLAFKKGGRVPPGEKQVTVNDNYGRPEFIMNDVVTSKNLKHFEEMNKHNLSLEEYVGKHKELLNDPKIEALVVERYAEQKEQRKLQQEMKYMRRDFQDMSKVLLAQTERNEQLQIKLARESKVILTHDAEKQSKLIKQKDYSRSRR